MYDTVIVHVCYGLNVLALYKYLYMEREIFFLYKPQNLLIDLSIFLRQAGATCSLYNYRASFVHLNF